MATGVAVRSSIGDWCKIFPSELKSEMQSLLFVKKLFAVALSYVLYFRKIFAESAFHDKQLEEIKLKILKEGYKFPGSSKVVYWLKGCFDAIDRQYLKSATLVLYSTSGNRSEYNVIESYCFKVSYEWNNLSLSVTSKSERESSSLCELSVCSDEGVKLATLNLLKNIESAGKRLTKLPPDLMITMKLEYYSEVTPENYIPPGFKHADDIIFNFGEDNVNVRMGNVRTVHHGIKMHIQTNRRLLPGSIRSTQSTQEDKPVHDLLLNSKGEDKLNEEDELSLSLRQQTLGFDEGGYEVYEARCPCDVNKDDGIMVLCDGCGKWQHAVCFRILEERDAPTSHICEICANSKPELLQTGGITDETIQKLTVEARKTICLFRRALALCLNEDSVSTSFIAKSLGVEYAVARGIFNRLMKEQVIKGAGTRRGEKLVEKEYLESIVLPRFFSRISLNEKPLETAVSPQLSTHQQSATIRHTPGSISSILCSITANKRNCSNSYGKKLINASQDSTVSPISHKIRKMHLANTPIGDEMMQVLSKLTISGN
ncbi:unnamed protein product [Heterobilharzia americana]|nr:unnamed protein product [Heterobilharzia americana]